MKDKHREEKGADLRRRSLRSTGQVQLNEKKPGTGVILEMPLIPLRGLTVFPGVSLTFDVARDKSRLAVKEAIEGNQMVFLTAQKDVTQDWPSPDDMFKSGCVARIRQVLEIPGGEAMKLLVEGRNRAVIDRFRQEEPFYQVEVTTIPAQLPKDEWPVYEAYRRLLLKAFDRYAAVSGRVSPEARLALSNMGDPSLVADTIAGHINLNVLEKQTLLETIDPTERIRLLITLLDRERHITEIEKEIGDKVRTTIEKNQKEYYLREQIKTIQKELGEQEGSQKEQDQYLR